MQPKQFRYTNNYQRFLFSSSSSSTTTTTKSTKQTKDNQYRFRDRKWTDYHSIYGGVLLATLSIYSLYKLYFKQKWILFAKENNQNDSKIIPGVPIDGLPVYSLAEVAKHNDPKTDSGVWIVYKAGVYDVTPFINEHPGGDNILLGAGNSVEPFWKVYSQHHTQQVYDILESYRIGNLRVEDRLKPDKNDGDSDSFEFIPVRDPSLLLHHDKPFNAETPGEILVQNFHTPNEKFFIRNHLSVPRVDVDDYVLEVEGFGLNDTFEFSLEQLKTLFPKHTVTSVIQCGGNRRDDLNKVKQVKGIGWKLGAIGNTRWSGAKLMDVLNYCQAQLDHPSIKHVQFEGLDLDATAAPYGASVPADKALDPNAEFILAYEMNGEPLPADHGFPIRLIAPGIVGARNVKWLARIILNDHESTSHWQRNDYKSFPPNKNHATPEEFARAHAIQEMPIQSAICKPKPEEHVKIVWKEFDGQMQPVIEAAGYAWSGGGRSVIRVDLSIDDGHTWYEAKLEQETPTKGSTHTYSWTLWQLDLPLKTEQLYQGNQIQIICRAFDSSHNTQPATSAEIWNFRGLLNNSWHRVNIRID
ncbi:sulfite oxidase [Dermatophagoides farinae]|uniref:sulfite oxidase n=1 Tax=Dermatophagoides farinae TaxID=6954 RepID=A0A9D4P6I8_DERFA|nr:sulfite oxidase [Dermatophagoides farinae]